MRSWRFISKTRLRFEPSRGCRCRGRRRSRRCTGQSAPFEPRAGRRSIAPCLSARARRKSRPARLCASTAPSPPRSCEPSDSSLLWNAVHVLVRLLKSADALTGGLEWRNHRRAAKKRARAIEYARDRLKRVQPYRELIALTRSTLAYAEQAAAQLWRAGDPMAEALWQAEFRHYRPLIERIIAQTERRVLHGEAIAANEKIVSLFEPHADIIVKGGRDVQYGHKLNLTTGRSGLILDLVIEAGNPADSDRFLPMLERHIALYGGAPRQTAADGGFASRDNLAQAKALGVHDVAFHKKAGLRILDMVKSNWVYRKLRNFRAGIESDISCLKRAYGLARCLWRGLDHFTAYVWSSVVAYNVALFARLRPI